MGYPDMNKQRSLSPIFSKRDWSKSFIKNARKVSINLLVLQGVETCKDSATHINNHVLICILASTDSTK